MRKPPVLLAWALALLLWLPPVALHAATVVFQDTFTEASDVNLVSHTPDTGTGWTERIDTGGSMTIIVRSATQSAGPFSSLSDNAILYEATPSPAIGSQDYDVSWIYQQEPSGNTQPHHAIFGYVDASNFCGVAVYRAAASPDVIVYKVVAGTASTLTSGTADTGPIATDTFLLEARGSGYTLKKNGSALISGLSDGDCDNAAGVGLGFGSLFTALDDIATAMRMDTFTVTDQTAVSATTPRFLLMGIGEPR